MFLVLPAGNCSELGLARCSVARALDKYPTSMLDSHRVQANISACAVWVHIQSNIYQKQHCYCLSTASLYR